MSNIWKRLADVAKATAHEALDRLEDPVMMLNHYIREMEEELEDAQEALLSQRAVERTALLRHQEYLRIAADLETRASEALAAGREAEARAALADKLAFEQKAAQYLSWHEEAGERAAELEAKIEQAKAELARLREKRLELTARAEKAAAMGAGTGHSGFASKAISGISEIGRAAARGFERIEEKILQWEAENESRKARGGAYWNPPAPHTATAAQIDEQLEALRRKQSAAN
jgi:Phage shock protein A (IM30), suppresses sigma54-dependent transcription